MPKITIKSVDHCVSADVVIASVYDEHLEPLARVVLSFTNDCVTPLAQFTTSDAYELFTAHQRMMIPVLVANALYDATTADDAIVYVPDDAVFPLTVEI